MVKKEKVVIFEVGPRDGLQNEKKQIATSDKIKLVDHLSACGFSKIEVTSFVSRKWVPQMSDAAEVLAGIHRYQSVSYAALTPNLRGFEDAQAAKVDEIAIFAAASEAFSQKNINCSIEESLQRFLPVVMAAKTAGIPVRGYVSCVTDCPYDGAVAPAQAAHVAKALIDLGCYEVSLGDTIGHATPESINKLLDAVLPKVSALKLAGHFHDTKGHALENIVVSLERGLRVFDSSIGGLGGCPYAPGARGNVATEAVVALLQKHGYRSGVDAERLHDVAKFARTLGSV